MAATEPRNTYDPCDRCGWDDHHMIYKCAERIEQGVDKVLVRRDDLAAYVAHPFAAGAARNRLRKALC